LLAPTPMILIDVKEIEKHKIGYRVPDIVYSLIRSIQQVKHTSGFHPTSEWNPLVGATH